MGNGVVSPSGDIYMGIDIGTSETKGVLIDGRGRIFMQCSTTHGMENPKPNYYEHDAEAVWWKDFCLVSQKLLRESGTDRSRIACVGASTLGSDCLPVDENCRPLRKAILYGIDSRSQEEIAWLTKVYGDRKVRELFGRPICSGDVAAKILWIKHHEQDVYERTHKFLTGSSYIAAKLTGRYVLDQFLAQASFRPLYRMDGSVNEEECSLYCRSDQLAEALPAYAVAGAVTGKAASETGLMEGTPVITGTGDSAAEAVSTGVLRPGDMMLQFGSTLFMYYCCDRPFRDDRMRGNNYLIPDTFSVAGGTNTAGTLTKWYRDVLYPDLLALQEQTGRNAYEAMLDGIGEIPPGSDGLITLPYFAGERTPLNDPNAKGVIFGLKLSHTRLHLYRSALESVGYSVNQHLEVLRENGFPLKKLMAVGGGAKNLPWMQMVADICGEPVRIAEVTLGAAYGDALMAALGSGGFQSVGELEQMIRVRQILTPDKGRHEIYRHYQEIYDGLYRNTKEFMHRV